MVVRLSALSPEWNSGVNFGRSHFKLSGVPITVLVLVLFCATFFLRLLLAPCPGFREPLLP